MKTYQWPLADAFLGRAGELARLEDWWDSGERRPIVLTGRRRVGKTWLSRRFAHGKPALLLLANELPAGVQLRRLASELEPVLGVRPDLPDMAALFRVLYRTAHSEKLLVVIDEFPWLLESTSASARRTLSTIQSVIEHERDQSQVKLVLCGSHVAWMDALFSEQNPMHGRLLRVDVNPLPFEEAAAFLGDHDGVTALERYAIAGGMPLYLGLLSRGETREAVCWQVLDRTAPLWNEGRLILEQELREPRTYFGILAQLASGDKELNEIGRQMRMDNVVVSKYLATLSSLRLVRRRLPLGAAPNARGGHWRLRDPFLRFWFRFVFPFQGGLEAGLRPGDLYDGEVAPALPGHVSPVFEEWCRSWLRANRGAVATVAGNWWGNALESLRRTGERSSEEIDAVGTLRNKVTLVAECKWTGNPLGPAIVRDLDRYKIPALRQAGFRLASEPEIVLFAKAGYTGPLRDLADGDRRITLVDVPGQLGNVVAQATRRNQRR